MHQSLLGQIVVVGTDPMLGGVGSALWEDWGREVEWGEADQGLGLVGQVIQVQCWYPHWEWIKQ